MEIGRELLRSARDYSAGVFSARFWNDQLMNWAMKDPAFKLQLFRFIDVFPMLRTPALVHDYLTDYLSQPGVTLPPGMELGLKVGGLAKGIMAKTITNRITAMAGNFIAGVDAATALPTLQKALERGRGLQRRSAGRGVRQRRRGRGLPAALSRSDRNPAGGRGQVAAESAARNRLPRPDPAHQRLDQNQLALRANRSDRLRGLAPTR